MRDLGAHEEAAAAGLVGGGDVGLAEDEAAGGEVRALDVLEAEVEVGARVFGVAFGGVALEQGDAGVHDLGEVVGRDVGGHADGDAGAAVDDEVGDARREDGGLERGLVVVGGEVDGVGVDVGEHLAGDPGEAGLGVAHGGGWVAVDGAEVALAIDHRVAQGEGLREADHGVVDGGVAVGMVVTHDVADDLGGLGVLLVELEAHLLHAVEDAAVDGLEAVAYVGQGAADDDRHGVVEVRPAHLFLNIDRVEECGAGTLDAGGGRRAASPGRRGIVGVCVLRGRGVRVVRKEFVSHGLCIYYMGFRADPGALTPLRAGGLSGTGPAFSTERAANLRMLRQRSGLIRRRPREATAKLARSCIGLGAAAGARSR